MPRRSLLVLTLALLLHLAAAAFAEPARPTPLYVMALPAAVSLVAFLPVAGQPGQLDLDVRVEVVLPRGCGDTIGGLLKRGGAKLDGKPGDPEAYDVLVERRPLGACDKDAKRIGARWAIRMAIADGQSRELVVGTRSLTVSRRGGAVTLAGEPPTGDVPGAPPTTAPRSFVVGEVTDARLVGRQGITTPSLFPGGPTGSAQLLSLEMQSRLPRCAGPATGLLARGDAESKFTLTHFDALALAPLDGSCGGKPVRAQPARFQIVWRGGDQLTVGGKALRLDSAAASAR